MALRDLPQMLAWCRKEVLAGQAETGATDENNGMWNQQRIRQHAGSYGDYPAFAGCAALGEDWYLPAIIELKKLYKQRTALSRAAERYGGEALKPSSYRASTESGADTAWGINFSDGYIERDLPKSWPWRVRPVATF